MNSKSIPSKRWTKHDIINCLNYSFTGRQDSVQLIKACHYVIGNYIGSA